MLRQKYLLAIMLSFYLSGILGCSRSTTSPQPEDIDVLISNVTVIDSTTGPKVANVRIDEGEILDVMPVDADGRSTTQRLIAQAERHIDGTGKYLIPGLWDFHVHFTYDERFSDSMGDLFLYHGITSVRDTGGVLDKLLPVVNQLRNSNDPRPDVYFSGPLLDGPSVVYDGDHRPGLGIANATPAEARRNIAEIHAAGASFLKIYEMVSPDIFAAIVEEAGQRNLPIDAHVPLTMLAREVAPKVQSLEHLRNYELDCIADREAKRNERVSIMQNAGDTPGANLRTKLHGLQRIASIETEDADVCANSTEALTETMSVPTLRLNTLRNMPPMQRADFEPALSLIPTAVREEWLMLIASLNNETRPPDATMTNWSLRRTGELHKAGAPIAAGTDTPIGLSIPGYSLHTELERLVVAGLSAQEALDSATLRPAEFFSIEDQLGRVRPGYKADLVLLSKNPLENIGNTRAVELVLKEGEVVDRQQLRDRLSQSPLSADET